MPSLESLNVAPSLQSLQKDFWGGVRGESEQIYSFINYESEFLPHQRLEVYRTTARSTHVATLLDVFPVCCAVLGKDYFTQLAIKYFRQMPSLNPDMNAYGKSFPGFLAKCIVERAELKEFSYLVDLARLEWEWQAAYFSAGEILFDTQLFQNICSEHGADAVLKLQASIRLLSSPYPIYQIWHSHRDGSPGEELKAILNRQYLCIYKQNFQVRVELVDVNLYALLITIQRGYALTEVAEFFSSQDDLNNALTIAMKKQWLAESYISKGQHGS